MRYILVIMLTIMSINMCYAQTYSKVDDTTIRCVESKEVSTDMTIAKIKHELEGVRNDMAVITERYNEQMETFKAIEEKYQAMHDNCESLGVKEKVEPIPVELVEPTENTDATVAP